MALPSEPPRQPLYQAALEYAAKGIPVFPVRPRDKHPLTEHGFLDATTDAETITRWWRKWRGANIGIPTGKASGWLVVDIDTKAGATYDTLAALGPLRPTLTAQTGSGGLHLVYAYPADVEIRNSASKIAPGIDIRGEGGYIVAAPSLHPSGGQYEWVNELAPVEAPAWIVQRLTQTVEPTATRKAVKQAAPFVDSEDHDGYWLAWAQLQSRQGTGDYTGYLLAQQLLTDPDVNNVDNVLSEYAAWATLDTSNPFDSRSIDRWLKSAQGSRIVVGGEPAKRKRQRASNANQHASSTTSTVTQPLAKRPVTQEEATPPTDADLLRGEANDNGNAETMWRVHGHEWLYTPAYGWLQWTGTHWSVQPEPIVQQDAIATLKQRQHAAVDAENKGIIRAATPNRDKVGACMALFKSYVIEPETSAYDRDRDALNCANGTLSLRTGELTPHDYTQRHTYCVPVDYDPQADMSVWQAFVFDALGRNEEAIRYFQLCVGYSLTGHTSEEKMFYLHGPTRAGKGTVTETLLALLPTPLSIEVDFSSFTAKRDNDSQNFDLAELRPARLVVASESNRGQSLNPGKVKALTGGNPVRCAFKHKDMFTYRPQFKVWLVSNHELNADADDDALWGRVQVFTFPHSHLGSEDTTLKARMRSPDVLRGVLRWCVEGAQAWYRIGKLEAPTVITDATRAHRETQDYIRQWIDESCTLDPERVSLTAGLRESYHNWCENMGIKPVSPNVFAEALVKRFGCKPHRQAGTGMRGFAGIGQGVTPRDSE